LAFFAAEAWFHLQGYVNTQNNPYWSSQNPYLTLDVLLQPVKASVWCAVSAEIVYLCFFFNETINCERYVQVILGQFFPELTEEEKLYGLFEQDSATAHTSRMSMQALSDVFWDRNISINTWSARSPDLNTCDFFLGGGGVV
jgi:hypothetical protein